MQDKLNMYEQYEHHGETVWVKTSLKGKHREHCLCFSCSKFKPGKHDNCPIASGLYVIVCDHGLVSPVYECPEFDNTGTQ